MKNKLQIIVLNPGSTSTKVAVFDDLEKRCSANIRHPANELSRFPEIRDQLEYRKATILHALQEFHVNIYSTDAFSGRCTGLLPMPGGVYEVNELMYQHGAIGIGSKHPGNLGPMLALDLSRQYGGRSFVVEPSSIDEFRIEARLTGMKDILRTSRGHPLNQREVAARFAAGVGKQYTEINAVVVHMGGGISVSAHQHGRIVDSADSTRGEGRMAPTRSGAVPAASLVKLCFSGKYTERELLNKIMITGGWVDLLGTSDAFEVEKRIDAGDTFAKLVMDTTIYQISKDIGAYAAVLSGEVDGILLTGGLAKCDRIVNGIKKMTQFIAPIYIYPGEFEMEALAAGALRVLQGRERAQNYTGKPVFQGFCKNS